MSREKSSRPSSFLGNSSVIASDDGRNPQICWTTGLRLALEFLSNRSIKQHKQQLLEWLKMCGEKSILITDMAKNLAKVAHSIHVGDQPAEAWDDELYSLVDKFYRSTEHHSIEKLIKQFENSLLHCIQEVLDLSSSASSSSSSVAAAAFVDSTSSAGDHPIPKRGRGKSLQFASLTDYENDCNSDDHDDGLNASLSVSGDQADSSLVEGVVGLRRSSRTRKAPELWQPDVPVAKSSDKKTIQTNEVKVDMIRRHSERRSFLFEMVSIKNLISFLNIFV
jgi:hypothetical protein